MDIRPYHDSLTRYCELLPEQGEVLELACGPGNITRYLLQQKPGLRILATDLAPNMLELAREHNPDVALALLDMRDIPRMDRTFDGIVCGFGMPYLSKEQAIQFIADAAQQLKPGGALYFSTMEDDYEKSYLYRKPEGDEVFLYFHEEGYLLDAVKANHLTAIDIRHLDGSMSKDLVVTAVKSLAL